MRTLREGFDILTNQVDVLVELDHRLNEDPSSETLKEAFNSLSAAVGKLSGFLRTASLSPKYQARMDHLDALINRVLTPRRTEKGEN